MFTNNDAHVVLNMLVTLHIVKCKLNELTNKFEGVQNQKRNTKSGHLKEVKRDSKNEFNEDHVVVAVLLILFIVIINVVSILGYIVYQEWIFFETKLIEDFSVPCSSLSLSPDEDYVTFDLNKSGLKTYIDDKGNYICSKKNFTEILQTVNVIKLKLKSVKI
jgi:F0F1-type ATP synthase membrane subunit a